MKLVAKVYQMGLLASNCVQGGIWSAAYWFLGKSQGWGRQLPMGRALGFKGVDFGGEDSGFRGAGILPAFGRFRGRWGTGVLLVYKRWGNPVLIPSPPFREDEWRWCSMTEGARRRRGIVRE